MTTDLLGVDTLEIFALVVNEPIDVEVLDGAHDDFDALERHRILTVLIAARQRPQLRQRELIFLATLRSHEAQRKIKLRHLSARNIDLGVEDDGLLFVDHIFGHEVQFLARHHKVLLKAIIHELV